MYCGKCGMPLAFGKSECSICGYDESHDDNNSSNNKKSNKGLIIGIIVAVILIPIIILGLISVFLVILFKSFTICHLRCFNKLKQQTSI